MGVKTLFKKNRLVNTIYYSLLKLRKKKELASLPFIENLYKTDFSKNALLSYITKPFLSGQYHYHTNSQESIILSKLIQNFGYNIDVVDFDNQSIINDKKYNLIIGFGLPYKQAVEASDTHRKKIFYSTGMHPIFNNQQTIKRIKEFSKKTGIYAMKSARYLNEDYISQIDLSDTIVGLGNEYVKDIYHKFTDVSFHVVPPTFYEIYNYKEIIDKKKFKDAKTNFLFFSGGGLVHKGLDLILEHFKTRKDLNLHICCSLINERDFAEYYKKQLYGQKNIKFYGFVDLYSQQFKKLLIKCGFILFPSCAEGGGASVVNVIGNSGIIPIATKESSIPINDYGVYIDDLDQESIKKSINEALILNEVELRQKSIKCGQFTSQNNSTENFQNTLTSILESIL